MMRGTGLLLAMLLHAGASGAAEAVVVEVSAPYLELHTGPGAGFPVLRVVEKGARVTLLKRRTDWVKVRDIAGHEGWVADEQLSGTMAPGGGGVQLAQASRADYMQRRWEAGALGGDFGGAKVITLYGGYAFNPALGLELSASQVLGTYSSSVLAGVNLTQQPFPEWRFSPFFTLGAGGIRTRPNVTLVRAAERNNAYAQVGLGVRAYLTRRFVLRLEYLDTVVLASDQYNEDIEEWKAGFAVFF